METAKKRRGERDPLTPTQILYMYRFSLLWLLPQGSFQKNMKVELKCLMGKVLDSTAILILNFGGKSGLCVEVEATEVLGHL